MPERTYPLARIVFVFAVVAERATQQRDSGHGWPSSISKAVRVVLLCLVLSLARSADPGVRVAEYEACSVGRVVTVGEENGHRSSSWLRGRRKSSCIFVIFLWRPAIYLPRRDTNESKIKRLLDPRIGVADGHHRRSSSSEPWSDDRLLLDDEWSGRDDGVTYDTKSHHDRNHAAATHADTTDTRG